MADYISKYTGAQIDLAVASGSTPSGHITASGNVNVGGNISSSGKIFSDDEIHLRDANSSGDTLLKAYASNDDGILDVYQNNSVIISLDGRGGHITASGHISGSVTTTGSFSRIEIAKNQTIGTGQTITAGGQTISAGGITLSGGQAVKGIESEIKAITSALTLQPSSSGMTVIPSGGARIITLPHVASGSGCSFRIIAGSAHQHIVTASNPNAGADNSLIYGHIIDNNNGTSADGAGGTVVAAADKITLNSNCQIGDSITIVGDGTNWYVSGIVKDAPTVA
tara:strand:- start:491 stop:1336 length:846 start_codon:yes stop_codon:yes gene_type:complete